MSGLLSHQDRLNVVGDNISNSNTVAFKRSRVAFAEMLGQQLVGVSRTQGGDTVNPAFVGNGTKVSSIDKNWNQGTLESTQIRTDLALNGDGYFVAKKGGRNIATRAGNFSFNEQGTLVTSTGLDVQGYGVDANGNVDASQLTNIKLDPNTKDPPKFTENMAVAGNLSSDAAVGDTATISTSVYDEQGKAHNVVLEYTKTGANTWDVAFDTGGSGPFAGNASGASNDIYQATIAFNTDGSIDTVTGDDANGSGDGLNLSWDNAAVSGGPDLDISLEPLTQYSGSSTVVVEDQDGHASGELVGYNFDTKGRFVLNFSNGEQQIRGQLALANVNNPNGLEQIGDNLYGATAQSGELSIGRAGREVSTSVVAGSLEQSNVDIATEFTDMITTQRGYQASARVITTSDEILQETLQLKR